MAASLQRRNLSIWLAAFAGVGSVCATTAKAQSHPTGVPTLNSRPGAAYTIYLDFAGFTFTGGWGGNGNAQPGTTPAYNGVTSSFSSSDQNNIDQIWARAAEKYSIYNVNVTTVDPAVAAGKADTDAHRQAFYDVSARTMHTVIGGGGSGSWTGGGGISYVSVTPYSIATDPNVNGGNGIGYHTNWVLVNSLGGTNSYQAIAEATAHENGHGLGLNHQADFTGTTVTNEYSSNNGSQGSGSFAPIMGVSYYSQRGLWRSGTADAGGPVQQNDAQVIANDPNMNGFITDGVGHARTAATALPLSGSLVNFNLAKGVITPASSGTPNPIGVSNYTSDFFSFSSGGGSVSLTVHDGSENLSAGSADPGATLDSTLSILDTAGNVLYTAGGNYSTLSETITQTLPAGVYYAQISSAGGKSGSFNGVAANYYDAGSYFLTGSGLTSSTSANFYWAGTASAAKWSQIDGSSSNWRTDHANGTDPGVAPSASTNVFFTTDSNATNLTTTLGGSRAINSLNFTGSGTTAAGTSVTIAADGSTLTLNANGGYLDAGGNAVASGVGLVVQSGSASHYVAVPVALGNSQTWQINNSPANPLTVSGVVSGVGKALTVSGTGKLILSGANSYSGGTTVSGAIVSFASPSLGFGPVTLTNGGLLQFAPGNTLDLTNGRTFTIGAGGGQLDTNSNNVVFGGNIAGNNLGYLTKLGAGTLTLNGTANPSALFVRTGTLALGNSAVLSTASMPVGTVNNYTSIGQLAGDIGTLTLAGNASFTGAGDTNVADVSATGVLNLSGNASLKTRTLAVAKFGNANGTIVQTGGSINQAESGATGTDWRFGGYGSSSDAAAVAKYNLSGGSLNSGPANLQIGAFGTGTVTQTGGSVTVGGYLSIGRFAGGVGTYDMSSGNGSLTAIAQSLACVGEQGAGTLDVGGASTVTVNSLRLSLTNGSAGAVVQSGGVVTAPGGVQFGGGSAFGGAASTGTYSLNGGVLTTSSVTRQASTLVTGNLNLNGGTLRASSNNVSLLNGLTNITVQANGAIVDTNGNNVSIDQSMRHDPALGTTPDGGLTKNGNGALSLTATQNFTGPTTVNGGTLRLAAAPTAPVAGAVAWFDAADASTLTTASGIVTAWANKGTAGASLNAVQTVAGVGPTIAAGTNGNTVLNFNANTSGLVTASNLGVAGAQDRTLFVVGARGAGNMFFAHEGVVGSNNLAYGISSETGNAFYYTWANDITFAARTPGAYEIYDSELTSNGTALSGDLISGGVLSTASKTVAANTTAGPLYLGDRPTGTATGNLGEVIEYDGALSASQRASVEAYLNYKWFGIAATASNVLPTTTSINLTAVGATLDLNNINQTVTTLSGVTGSAVTLGSATLTTGSSTSTTFGGVISGTGSLSVRGSGTFTLSGSNAFTGTTTVASGSTLLVTPTGTVSGAGPLVVNGSVTLQPRTTGGILVRNQGPITIGSDAVVRMTSPSLHTNRMLLVAPSLTTNGTGFLDVGTNDLDLQSTAIDTVTGQIQSGFAQGAWTGGGIISSAALSDSSHLTALGVLLNNDGLGQPIYGGATSSLGLFDGTAPGLNDVLVKYTYFGDANLDGVVDGSDYTKIDHGFTAGLSGWSNGDFNYDGVVDGSDYTLIDNAFNTQGPSLSTSDAGLIAASTAQIAGTAAVPEPAGVVLIAVASAVLSRKGRRHADRA